MRWLPSSRSSQSSGRRHYSDNQPAGDIKTAEPVWLSEFHRRQLLCFVHIPKATGTSFKNLLWHVYGRGFVNYHPRLSGYSPESLAPEQAKEMLAIGGHLAYGFHRCFGPLPERERHPDGIFAGREILYVSVVRNPVDRLLSYFRFVRTFPAHRLHDETKGMECEQFFAHMIAIKNEECVGDQQCQMITGGAPERAIEYVKTKFLAVAALEGVEAMVGALGKRLDWPEVRMAQKNRSPETLTTARDRELVDAFCREYCQGDIALHAFLVSQPSGFVLSERS